MSQADVVFADVTFTKCKGKWPGETSIYTATTYAEVKINQPSRSQKPESSARGSKVTSERVALIILLTVAVVALIYISWDSIQTKENLHRVTEMKRNITERYDELKESVHKETCPASVNTTQPCPVCPVDWVGHGDQCYYFNENAMTWELARDQCQQRGADLVRIDSEDKQTFLSMRLKVKMINPEDKHWIGLTDAQTEDTWLWVDGSPLNESLKFWSHREPDNWHGRNEVDGEDCVRMGERSGRMYNWFDQDCNAPHKSICEKSALRGNLFCVL